MVAYKLYKHDPSEGDHLIGVLPERRKNQKRITEESVLKWGKEVMSDPSDRDSIYFVQIET